MVDGWSIQGLNFISKYLVNLLVSQVVEVWQLLSSILPKTFITLYDGNCAKILFIGTTSWGKRKIKFTKYNNVLCQVELEIY